MLNFIKKLFQNTAQFLTKTSNAPWCWIWDDVTKTAIPHERKVAEGYYFSDSQGKNRTLRGLSPHKRANKDWDTEKLIKMSESLASAFLPGSRREVRHH